MSNAISVRIYFSGKKAARRLKNIEALAKKYFPKSWGEEGNVTALFHDAVNFKYKLDPQTGDPLIPKDVKSSTNQPR